MKQIIILCSTILLLASCHIYKPYSRPKVTTDGLYGPAVATEDTTSIATLPILFIFMVFQKQFVAGVMGGAVKE